MHRLAGSFTIDRSECMSTQQNADLLADLASMKLVCIK